MNEETLYEFILQVLGVEEGDKVNVICKNGERDSNNPYCFEKDSLFDKDNNCSNLTLIRIIRGEAIIEMLPWKPKGGDMIWTIDYNDGFFEITETYFSLVNSYDLAKLKCGWYFKTEKEAIANRERVIAEMKEVIGND